MRRKALIYVIYWAKDFNQKQKKTQNLVLLSFILIDLDIKAENLKV